MNALAIVVTDSHYNKNNMEEVNDCLFQSIMRGEELKCKLYIHCGDVFTSRYGRSFEELKAFSQYIAALESSNFEKVFIIPGNHDKKDQSSDESYLDIFKRNDSKIQIVSNYEIFNNSWINFCFLPFFSENVYSDKISSIISKIKKKGKYFLFTHVAVNGVKNNDGSLVENDFDEGIFSPFERVFVGHYHNRQEFDNITYFGSLKQNDFGEDREKGWMILNEDGSYFFEQSLFVEYKSFKIDLSKENSSRLISLYKQKYGDNPNFKVKITLKGTEEQLSFFDKKDFTELGIILEKIRVEGQIVSMDQLKIKNANFFDYFDNWLSQEKNEKIKETLEKIKKKYVENN